MPVPTTGIFSMFGHTDNTTIAGAIVEGGANSTTVANTNNFNDLKGLADINRFDPNFSEGATTLTQIIKTSQFRGYPIPTTTTTTVPPFSGDCNTFFFGVDAGFTATFGYYAFPSGNFIEVTLTNGQTTTVNAYENPGVFLISGSGETIVNQGSCSTTTTSTTTTTTLEPTTTTSTTTIQENNRKYRAEDCGILSERILVLPGTSLIINSVYRITSETTSTCFTIVQDLGNTADPVTYVLSDTESTDPIAIQIVEDGCGDTSLCLQI